jgi:hypothetical protein
VHNKKFICPIAGCLIFNSSDPIVRSVMCFHMHMVCKSMKQWDDLDGSLQISAKADFEAPRSSRLMILDEGV